jgi:hypothetical protein
MHDRDAHRPTKKCVKAVFEETSLGLSRTALVLAVEGIVLWTMYPLKSADT